MRALFPMVGRLGLSLAIGAVVGILTGMSLSRYVPPADIALAACVASVGGWAGSEFALRRYPAWQGRRLAVWIILLGIVSFVYGVLLVLLTPTGIWVSRDMMAVVVARSLLLVPVALVGLLAGFLAGRRGLPVAWVDGFVAPLVTLVWAIGVALGAGLYVAVIYVSPCMAPRVYRYGCVDPGRWFSLQIGLLGALAVGLWLGVTLWLALGLGGALRPRSPLPPRTLTMGDDASTPV
jgi:hypothetical protein